jgi:hypothetical protein
MSKKTVDVTFGFDGTSDDAIRVAERQAGAMVKRITEETTAAIRGAVSRMLRDGVPPYDAARTIKSTIGLNEPQTQAVLNYRERLIDGGLHTGAVNAAVDRYANKLLDVRARTIARTEIMDALNTGQDEAWQEAQAEGLLGKDAEKEWITADPCDDCEEYDGETVGIGEEFEEGDPPLHPNCRCTIGLAAG